MVLYGLAWGNTHAKMWTHGCEFSKTCLACWRIKAYTAYTWWWNLHFQTANICKCVFFPVRNSYSSQSMPAFKPWSVCNWWHCFIISWSFCKTLASCRSVWSLLYFFRMLYLGVLADRHLFLCQACVTAKIEPYLTVLEEKDAFKGGCIQNGAVICQPVFYRAVFYWASHKVLGYPPWPQTDMCVMFVQLLSDMQQSCCCCWRQESLPPINPFPTPCHPSGALAEPSPSCTLLSCSHAPKAPKSPALGHRGQEWESGVVGRVDSEFSLVFFSVTDSFSCWSNCWFTSGSCGWVELA